ncbi:MAG TPA: DinB family protein, partial [Anaerolineales bacterium]|nr:DinB family protein [Anaerolineales bacterium]
MMPSTDTLTTLFRHHLWANMSLFERCADLTPEQLDATLLGTFGSIRETLEHIARAEQNYLHRIRTGQRLVRPENAPPLTMAEMLASLRATGEGLIEWAGKVQPDDMVQLDWEGTPRDTPKTIILTQAINHATEHRSQVMAILTQLGIQPP